MDRRDDRRDELRRGHYEHPEERTRQHRWRWRWRVRLLSRSRKLHPARGGTAIATCLAIAVPGCAADRRPTPAALQRSQVERYVREVEPIRLAVNRLLEGADPVLGAFAGGRIAHGEAAGRMDALERRFAAYAVAIAALDPPTRQLQALNTGYAETYVLEDAYLSALAAGLADGHLDDLPDTQDAQRAAIIRWRTRLTVLADAAGAALPADLQQAGRGEIAPSPDGS